MSRVTLRQWMDVIRLPSPAMSSRKTASTCWRISCLELSSPVTDHSMSSATFLKRRLCRTSTLRCRHKIWPTISPMLTPVCISSAFSTFATSSVVSTAALTPCSSRKGGAIRKSSHTARAAVSARNTRSMVSARRSGVKAPPSLQRTTSCSKSVTTSAGDFNDSMDLTKASNADAWISSDSFVEAGRRPPFGRASSSCAKALEQPIP
mmetsp:Transcript_8481/g.18003  ORF Transcript_8481/g.18003 Transcript_8481/m.18003 type:complete len:207 (-) Transcript_8481:707-1327(-)